MKHIRLQIVEDNRLFCDCITAMVKTQPDMRIVAVTGGNTRALEMAHQLKPHVLLIGMGRINQSIVQIVKSASRELPEVKVIGMGLFPAEVETSEFVTAEVSGLIMNDATSKRFLGTIRTVAKSTRIRQQSTANSPTPREVVPVLRQESGKPVSKVRITVREREIIESITDGLSNKAIAETLNIATYTVKSHVHNIFQKLGVHSRLQMTVHVHNDNLSTESYEPFHKMVNAAYQ
jgi:DNA-binding NarL/FixJ family response regulator